jgi:hypothetical protein
MPEPPIDPDALHEAIADFCGTLETLIAECEKSQLDYPKLKNWYENGFRFKARSFIEDAARYNLDLVCSDDLNVIQGPLPEDSGIALTHLGVVIKKLRMVENSLLKTSAI